MKFQKGDVVLFNNKNIYGMLIQRYNFLKYGESVATHCGIIGEVKKDHVTIYEALDKGFVKNDYEEWWLESKVKSKNIIIKRSIKRLTKVTPNCEKYLGRPYAWLDIARVLITQLLGFHLSFGTSKTLICSEAVSRVLYDSSNKKLNLSNEFNKPYDLITPMDIYLSRQLK